CVSLAFVTLPLRSQDWLLTVPQRAVFSVASNPLNRASVVAGNYSRGFVTSADGGTTWQELSVGDPSGTSQMSALLFHPRDTLTLFAGGIGFTGLDRSTDGGFTWENVLKDPIGSRFEVASNGSIAFYPGRPDTMYVIRSSPGVVFRSVNRGENWDSIGIVPGLSGSDRMRALAICPNADSAKIMLACGRKSAIYRSTDGGKTWASTGYAFGGQPDTDGAQIRWSPTIPGKVYAVAQYSLIQNTGNGGLYVSTDYGVTWAIKKFQDTSLYALEVFPTKNGDEIFVGGSQLSITSPALKGDSIVYRSIDGGTTWQDLSNVAWVENELNEVVANVWGFALVKVGDRQEVLMATEVGAYRSASVTSVTEGGLSTKQMQLLSSGSSVLVSMPENVAECSYAVSTILGQTISMGTLRGVGVQRIDLSAYPMAPYLVRVFSGEHSGVILTSR
ncbi:MAG: hypothetical protein NTX15_02085, partial [Candidatus Kapabacteria bacterium]|nr:hypothetical protein [Candidatus Kapabacteria bacterium]